MLAQDIICIEEKENMENHFSLTKNWYILLELVARKFCKVINFYFFWRDFHTDQWKVIKYFQLNSHANSEIFQASIKKKLGWRWN